MKEEVWKDIPGYNGEYQISSLGNVKSFKKGRERILKKICNKSNIYYRVNLWNGNKMKMFSVHQLMAIAFLNHNPCGMKLVVNHINLNKLDNRLENLEIVTNRENSNRKHISSTSRYTGVCWHKRDKIWRAQINIGGKMKHLGSFKNEIDAHKAYQEELNKILKK